MPRAIYFDCFSGISGDMALGALLDAGLSLDALRTELAKLPVDGWQLDAKRDVRGYLSGTRALVDAPEQQVHRHLSDVQQIIEGSTLATEVKARSSRVFTLLAEAEGHVHGVSREQVHFHEVGALDAIIDVVGVVAGLWLLGIEEIYASALPLGTGSTRAAHGALPVPAPATLNLLAAANAPITADTTPFELVTPTGAALLAGLATFTRPALRLSTIGYGLGKRDLARPNALRVWIGERESEESSVKSSKFKVQSSELQDTNIAHSTQHSILNTQHSALVLLETNIDDQPAEQLAYVAEQLLAQGALDAWQVPMLTKKGRLATVLCALVPAPLEDATVGLILRETTTLGVRRRMVERHVCEREVVTVATPLGDVRVKRKSWQGQALGGAPEYEDCARLARAHGLPLHEVYRIVEAAVQLGQERI